MHLISRPLDEAANTKLWNTPLSGNYSFKCRCCCCPQICQKWCENFFITFSYLSFLSPFLLVSSCVCKEGEIGDARSCYKDLMSEINKLSSPGMFSRKLSTARKMFGRCLLNLFGELSQGGARHVSKRLEASHHNWTLTVHAHGLQD